jgi:hypothetical protein
MNTLWQSWIIKSIVTWFKTKNGSYPLYYEYEPRDDNTMTFFELRIDGPNFVELSQGCWQATVMINVLIQNEKNYRTLYTTQDMVKQILPAFENIEIYKYGTEPESDSTFLGCLEIKPGRGAQDIEINHYGSIKPFLDRTQSTIEAVYTLLL